jgi:Holliday junction resolvasome RuvABC endonuclease subunit
MTPSEDRVIKVVGQDPSLRNWGLAVGHLNLKTKKLTIEYLDLTNPVLTKGKQVRQNSYDLESALQLYKGASDVTIGAHAVFVEVPVGSQSARAMASYGICVGVLGALRANGIPFFEVTPTEVKLASVGNKTASKQDMIKWAMETHPEANWPTYKQNGKDMVSEAKAEHMADAVAAIYAGLACNSFQQMLPFMAATS